MRLSCLPAVLLSALVATAAFSSACTKKDANNNGDSPEAYKDIEKTFDKSEPAPEKRKPIAGVDSTKLDKPLAVRFEALVDKLPSPCGKAHSLRTSRNTDASCKRASFATEYVYELVKDGASNSDVKDLYKRRFGEIKVVEFKTSPDTPHHGPTDAPATIVEFFDYGCPACKAMKPVIEEALKSYDTEVVIYYKQFPLGAHPDSHGAAQAALAAHKQGKFFEMHDLLFADQHAHKLDSLKKYAEKIGVDMGQWNKDYEAVSSEVDAEKAEGEGAGVNGTPAVYINGRVYQGPSDQKYLRMSLDEALAEAI